MPLSILTTRLNAVLVMSPTRFHDERGYFEECWNKRTFRDAGIDVDFVQDNHSFSKRAGTLRGLHFQSPPYAQAKLIRCTRGAIFDVAVDIRKGSKTYGHWVGENLSAENGKQIFIPAGFLHGFLTLESGTEIDYKCSDYYHAASDGAVRWDSLGIAWPLTGEPLLSDKDKAAPRFADFTSSFNMGASA